MSLTQKCFVVVTGASRGIGREICVQLASKVAKGSTLLLIARNQDGLGETAKLIERDGVIVETRILDLGDTTADFSELAAVIKSCANEVDSAFIFHNAGSIGDLSKSANDLNDTNNWHKYLQANLISTIVFNSFLSKELKKLSISVTVVNITSLLAVQAFPSFTQYSVGKAAREAFFRALALEENNIRVLQYSPGPVETNMRTEIAEKSYSCEIRAAFSSEKCHKASQQILTTEQTVGRLLGILVENKFESGARIDYFDP